MSSVSPVASRSRLSVILAGYGVAIAGTLTLFSLPLWVSLLILVAGAGVTALGCRGIGSGPLFTSRTLLAWLAGSLLLLAVLSLIGEDRVRRWTPHPASFQPALWVVISMVRHLLHLRRHEAPAPSA